MTDPTEDTCPSKAYVSDELVRCRLDPGHAGVHLGPLQIDDHEDELVQWTEADAATDSDPVSELPVWYHALPLGQSVYVIFRDDVDSLVGELNGVVLDDHEQPGAVVVDGADRRRLIPWRSIALISWEHDK